MTLRRTGLVAPVAAFVLLHHVATAQTTGDGNTVYYFNADWSPDGTSIAFESGLDQQLSIYSISIDISGTRLTRLTDNMYNDEGPVWSPDGTQIAFFSNRRDPDDSGPFSLQLYIMNPDGTDQRRITDYGAFDSNISWSPDGTQLAFQSRPEGNPFVNSIYVVNADGSGRRRVTDGRHDDAAPAWSPAGNLIAYTRSVANYRFFRDLTPEERSDVLNAPSDIVVLDLNDGTTAQITQNAIPDLDPSWNSDGSAIYYLQDDGNRRTLIRRRLAESTPMAVATDVAVYNDNRVTRTRLSPNGRFLSYTKHVEGVYGLYIYDLELRRERRLAGG